MEIKLFVILGSLLGAFGIAFGAIGAHSLKLILSHEQLNIIEIGVRYQMYHALALIACGLSMTLFTHEWLPIALWCMFIGSCLFSGSLYLYALTLFKPFAIITPLGGTFLVISWILYTFGVLKSA